MTRKGTALITGASGGIGLDLARCFARDGHDLVLAARSEGKLIAIAEELSKTHGVQARAVPTDLSQAGSAARLFESLGGMEIEFLVNNAGVGSHGLFAETPLTEHQAMLHLNIVSLTELTQLLLPGMLKRGRGRILNVASTAAFQPGPLMNVYYASKAYVLSFSEGLANEVAGLGVTVTALCPGPVHTGFQKAARLEGVALLKSPIVMSSRTVAEKGYRGLMRGRRLIIPGLLNWILAFSTRFAPIRLSAAITRKLQSVGTTIW